MATTAERGYPYPLATGLVRPYLDIQALAEALDAEIADMLDPPVVRLVQQSAQTGLTTGTDVYLTFGSGSEDIKTHSGLHSTSVNNTRINITKTGIWRLRVKSVYAFSTTISSINVHFRKNGTTVIDRSGNEKPATINVNQGTEFSALAALSSGEYVEAGTQFVGSANQATNGVANSTCVFEAEWLRPLP